MRRLPGRRMRLLEVIDLADMPGCVGELETDALAMPAGRKPPALVDGNWISPNKDDHHLRHNLYLGYDDLASAAFWCHRKNIGFRRVNFNAGGASCGVPARNSVAEYRTFKCPL